MAPPSAIFTDVAMQGFAHFSGLGKYNKCYFWGWVCQKKMIKLHFKPTVAFFIVNVYGSIQSFWP